MIYISPQYTRDPELNLPTFPNGEINLEKVNLMAVDTLVLKWESNADLFNLLLLKKHADKRGFKLGLRILYMPYSRMDRDGNGTSDCSLRYVGEFIQNLGFKSITVVDPHSELTLAYLGTKAYSEYPFNEGLNLFEPYAGDPVKIICGLKVDSEGDAWVGSECVELKGKYYTVVSTNENRAGFKLGREVTLNEVKGVVELLWETFGGTTNEKGYKCLDGHIGAIYGDAITLERCEAICAGLARKNFASTNVVFGIGSYTYQYKTRDTFGFALKSTHVTINGTDINIFKDPVTDNGIKKSLCGRVAVVQTDGKLTTVEGLDSKTSVTNDLLRPIFHNGVLLVDDTLTTVRARLQESL